MHSLAASPGNVDRRGEKGGREREGPLCLEQRGKKSRRGGSKYFDFGTGTAARIKYPPKPVDAFDANECVKISFDLPADPADVSDLLVLEKLAAFFSAKAETSNYPFFN
jgi:hypothetical protein